MNIKAGIYLIIKRASWTKKDANIVTVLNIEDDEVYYKYDGEHIVRARDTTNFCELEIVPLTSLTEVLT